MDNSLLPIVSPHEDYTQEDLAYALEFLMLREEGKTIEEIGDAWGISRRQVYNRVKAYNESGAMATAHDVFMVPRIEAISAAVDRVLYEWPSILDNIVRIAKDSKGKLTALEAAKWLHDVIVVPAVEAKVREGAPESAYASRSGDFDPQAAVFEISVKKKESARRLIEA
jgi:hypothetical protein